jgi:hypothetical protein
MTVRVKGGIVDVGVVTEFAVYGGLPVCVLLIVLVAFDMDCILD